MPAFVLGPVPTVRSDPRSGVSHWSIRISVFIFLCSIVLLECYLSVDCFLFCSAIPTPSFPLPTFGPCELIPLDCIAYSIT